VIVFLYCDSQRQVVVLTARVESADGRFIEQIANTLRPGDAWCGYTYDQLLALGSGRHDLPIPAVPADTGS
jgi:hypothetical protein